MEHGRAVAGGRSVGQSLGIRLPLSIYQQMSPRRGAAVGGAGLRARPAQM